MLIFSTKDHPAYTQGLDMPGANEALHDKRIMYTNAYFRQKANEPSAPIMLFHHQRKVSRQAWAIFIPDVAIDIGEEPAQQLISHCHGVLSR